MSPEYLLAKATSAAEPSAMLFRCKIKGACKGNISLRDISASYNNMASGAGGNGTAVSSGCGSGFGGVLCNNCRELGCYYYKYGGRGPWMKNAARALYK